jgi:hypothetical protein
MHTYIYIYIYIIYIYTFPSVTAAALVPHRAASRIFLEGRKEDEGRKVKEGR